MQLLVPISLSIALVLIGCATTSPAGKDPSPDITSPPIASTYNCPDGSVVADMENCPASPVAYIDCPDGTVVAEGASCAIDPSPDYGEPDGNSGETSTYYSGGPSTDPGAVEYSEYSENGYTSGSYSSGGFYGGIYSSGSSSYPAYSYSSTSSGSLQCPAGTTAQSDGTCMMSSVSLTNTPPPPPQPQPRIPPPTANYTCWDGTPVSSPAACASEPPASANGTHSPDPDPVDPGDIIGPGDLPALANGPDIPIILSWQALGERAENIPDFKPIATPNVRTMRYDELVKEGQSLKLVDIYNILKTALRSDIPRENYESVDFRYGENGFAILAYPERIDSNGKALTREDNEQHRIGLKTYRPNTVGKYLSSYVTKPLRYRYIAFLVAKTDAVDMSPVTDLATDLEQQFNQGLPGTDLSNLLEEGNYDFVPGYSCRIFIYDLSEISDAKNPYLLDNPPKQHPKAGDLNLSIHMEKAPVFARLRNILE